MARVIHATTESFHSRFGRPTWQQSEGHVEKYLTQTHGGGWRDQVDMLQGKELPPLVIGLLRVGSTRPDLYHAKKGVAIEVKNWPLDRIAGLGDKLGLQMVQRRWSMPAGTVHWMFWDLRGQRVGSLRDLSQFLDKLMIQHHIECEEVWFILDNTFVRGL